MAAIDYLTAWRRADADLIADAKAFWKGLGLTAEAAERRAPQLCAVARADRKVIGVTTVTLMDHTPLKSRLAFLRCAVAPEFRKHYLATFLTRNTLTIMEGWSLENPQEKLQGLGFIIEANELGSKAVYPQWADWNTHYNLIGFTDRGDQIRLAWFRHARLDPPRA
jgi:hypothetical protein